MFLKENVRLLRKHYNVLTKNDKNALPLAMTGIPKVAFEEDDVIDVGQDLFLTNRDF
jgi:hypothetical protein